LCLNVIRGFIFYELQGYPTSYEHIVMTIFKLLYLGARNNELGIGDNPDYIADFVIVFLFSIGAD